MKRFKIWIFLLLITEIKCGKQEDKQLETVQEEIGDYYECSCNCQCFTDASYLIYEKKFEIMTLIFGLLVIILLYDKFNWRPGYELEPPPPPTNQREHRNARYH